MIKTVLYIFISSLILASSCKKKDEVGIQASYSGSPMVNFNNYIDNNGNFGYRKIDLDLTDTFLTIDVQIKLTNTTGTAPNDIAIYLTKVDAIVSNYNTLNGTSLEPISNNSIALDYDFSKPVILKKGFRAVTIPLKINGTKLDLSKTNAIGIAISRVEGAELNVGDESRLVIEFGTKNKYDGYYQTKGAAYHPSYGNYVWNSQGIYACGSGFALITSGANSVDLSPGQPLFTAGALTYFSAVVPRLTISPSTNKVAITSTVSTTVFVPYSTYDSRYDPATKSFYVKFGWNVDRVATDTFTYCGPR